MDDRLHRDQQAWLERHRDADMLIVDTRLGHITEAQYFSPMKKDQNAKTEYARNFFRQVLEAESE